MRQSLTEVVKSLEDQLGRYLMPFGFTIHRIGWGVPHKPCSVEDKQQVRLIFVLELSPTQTFKDEHVVSLQMLEAITEGFWPTSPALIRSEAWDIAQIVIRRVMKAVE